MIGFGSMLKDYLEYNMISQSDFANRLGITQKHMNQILNKNADISLELMLAISLITDIDLKLIVFAESKKKLNEELNKKFKSELEIKKYLNTFYIKEMAKRNWLILKDKDSYLQNAYDLLSFLKIKNFDNFNNYSNETIFFKKKDDADLTKVFLWKTRCDSLLHNQKVGIYDKNNFNLLLEALKEERNKKFNTNNLVKLFNKHGIYLVIEDALKGSKIRGCTMVFGKNPAIYMTRYLKEKSSFYFALYHELGHVKSDYNKAKSKAIFDGDKEIEKRADNFAINMMISDDVYKEILMNYEDKETICKKNNIPLCFLYSRLAMEHIIKYNDKSYLNNRESIFINDV